MAAMAEPALRFLHGLANSMKIVAGRNHWEEQNERATKRANDDK